MKDEFEVTFVVEMAPKDVWKALTERTVKDESDSAGDVHYVLPGFPSFPPLEVEGASCTLIEAEEGQLLRVRKDHFPCAGTEIAVRLEQANTGTQVTVVQSGFGAFLDMVGRDTIFGHGHQIVADLRLYLERGLTVAGTVFGAGLGARLRETPIGLEVEHVDASGFAEAVGLLPKDLLLTLRGIRLHDHQQLWTVLALSGADGSIDVTWARGRETRSGRASL